VLVLYNLGLAVFPESLQIAFVAACLHIFSPAGIFLSAPYGESTFALLSFCGYLLFVWSFGDDGEVTAVHDALVAAAGLFWGAATTIRSNGLLNGLIFLEEVFRIAYSSRYGVKISYIRRLFTTGIGGIFIAIGFLVPQYIAFQEFCGRPLASEGRFLRPWCENRLPSIYTFVQSYYW
jgi:phosphatidylinositol glycan class V